MKPRPMPRASSRPISARSQPANTSLTVLLPQNNTGGGTLKLTAGLKYKPYFFGAFAKLIGAVRESTDVDFQATSEIRLKNTLEVALVLDNSGSMDYIGTGSGKKRIELLKEASKQLVDTIAGQAAQMKQISKPVQFALVPFSASVNVGPRPRRRAKLDGSGRASRRSTMRISTGRPSPRQTRKWSRLPPATTSSRAPAGERKKTRRSRASRSTAGTSSGKPIPAAQPPMALCELGGLRRGEAVSVQQQRRDADHRHPCHAFRPHVRARRAGRSAGRRRRTTNKDRLRRPQQLVERPDREYFGHRAADTREKYCPNISCKAPQSVAGRSRR